MGDNSIKKILVIGGHGTLGRPVVRHLVAEGYAVRAMARDSSVDKARKLLPDEVEVVEGDLRDVDSIKRAMEGVDAVYMNLETHEPKAEFKTDLDGPRNVIAALEGRPDVLVAKITGLDLKDTNGWWPNSDVKFAGEELIKASGHPYLLFRPTWFMESLSLFVNGDKAFVFGKKWHKQRWIAGDDYAKIVGAAFKKNVRNRTFNVQGTEPLDFDEALSRFRPGVEVYHVPMFVLRTMGAFVQIAFDLHRLFTMAANDDHGIMCQDTWDELHKPEMSIEDYCAYVKKTGDEGFTM